MVTACSTTLMMVAASEFFERLLVGRNVLTERREIEALVRYRYRGHSQGALVSALHKASRPSTRARWCSARPPARCRARGQTAPRGSAASSLRPAAPAAGFLRRREVHPNRVRPGRAGSS